MYNRRMNKAILFFTAAIITCAFCLGSRAQAATFAAPTLTIGAGGALRANKIQSDYKDFEYDGNGNLVPSGTMTATYQLDVPVYMSMAGDGYVVGYAYYPISFTTVIDGGAMQIGAVNLYFDSEEYTGLYCSFGRTSSSAIASGGRINTVYQNFHPVTQSAANQYGIGTLHVILTGIVNTGNIAPDYINFTFSIGSPISSLRIYPDPSDVEMAEIIKQAIINAIDTDFYGESPDKYSIIDMLSVYSQYLYSMDVRQEFIDNNISTLVSDIIIMMQQNEVTNENLGTLITALNNFYNLQVSDNNSRWYQLDNIIGKLQIIIDQGSDNTEGASEAQEAVNQLQSADAALQQPTLSNGDIFNPIDNAAAEYGGNAANIFWWTWDGRISLILTLVVSLGLVGFIIYGKSG